MNSSSLEKATEQVRDYWDSHTMGRQFAKDAGIEADFGTREFFDQLHPHMYRHPWVMKLIDTESKNRVGQEVLEVGCGMGFDSVEWAKRGLNVTSVDLTPEAVNAAKIHFDVMDMEGDIRVGDACKLEFEENTFDVVWSKGVLHATPDMPKAVNEVYRVLKPGGRAIILNLYHKYSWLVFLQKASRENIEFTDEDPPINKLHSKRQIARIFRKFDDLEIELEHYRVIRTLRPGMKAKLLNNMFLPAYNLIPEPLARPFGFKFIITGNKPCHRDNNNRNSVSIAS
ncbi:MAG: class I SAM-dependent methyltransferase [Chloroflexi bacterium]|nr:class I SAM-dependent methyltransferase [Chloroflexota bacterium]